MTTTTMTIETGDSFDLVKRIADDSIQLVVTSPPYNIGKEYERKASMEEYCEPYSSFAEELYRVAANGGNVCWQVGNFVRKGAVVPLDVIFYPIFIRAGFVLRNRIIWHFRHGLHAQRRLSGRYETVLWFSKGEPKFNLDPVRVPSLYPGKRRFKGPRKGELSGNPLGKNPSDFWPDLMLEEWENGVWDFPNVKANHPEKTTHPCQFPVELVERCVLAFSDPGDIVYDPFLGVGSAAVGAMRRGRRFIGSDVNEEYVRESRRRVELDEQGLLRTRRIGTPIALPKGKVAERPAEWR